MKNSLSSLPPGFFTKFYRSQNEDTKTALRRVLKVFSPSGVKVNSSKGITVKEKKAP